MVLIKIDSLSTHELHYIAKQEGIDNYDELSREELIEELKEIYEDDDSQNQSAIGLDVNKKFACGLTDYRGDDDEVFQTLPGVEELPSLYSETKIHVLTKNASWLYCYWSISLSDIELYSSQYPSYELFLSVRVKGKESDENYDISISKDDVEWNISVPHTDGSCIVSLVLQADKKTRIVLCESKEVPLVYCYWLEHKESYFENQDIFRRYLTNITNRDGYLINCDVVNEIVMNVKKEAEENGKSC